MNRTTLIHILALALLMVSCGEKSTNPGFEPSLPKFRGLFINPSWHPDGKWIAAEHSDSIDTDFDGIGDTDFSGIWLINSVTGYKQPLVRGFSFPDWSPDGKKLVAESGAQIFTMEVSSLEPARIGTDSILQLTFEGRNFFPAWSSDGEWIAYDNTTNCGSSVEPPASDSCGLLIIRADGSDKTFLTRGRMPDWSPDGATLIFIALGTNIFSMAVDDTTNITQLTNTDNSDYSHPRYSPDGSKIAISSKPHSGFSVIWIFNSDGSSPRQLTDGPDRNMDWSPDGNRIVFLRHNSQEPIEGNGELWVINTDGTNLRQLTFSQ